MVHVGHPLRALGLLLGACACLCLPAEAMEEALTSPALFLPGGMLGLQIGSPWEAARNNPSLGSQSCRQADKPTLIYDEVCFFKTSSRVSGAPIHDGFIVRKDDRVVLIGTGIAIKNLDDPLAEAVMRGFQTQVHAKFQQTGDDVLFVNLPDRRMSPAEMAGFSRSAPVLLVELEPEENELAVFYGYLAPVNAFSALSASN